MAAIQQKCCHDKRFCFMEHNHPALEDFDEDLAPKGQYTDIDGMVEIGGFILISEFKKSISGDHIPHGGQRQALEVLSRLSGKITIWLIEGDAPRKHARRMRVLKNGNWGDWQEVTWAELKECHKNWHSDCVKEHRRKHPGRPLSLSS